MAGRRRQISIPVCLQPDSVDAPVTLQLQHPKQGVPAKRSTSGDARKRCLDPGPTAVASAIPTEGQRESKERPRLLSCRFLPQAECFLRFLLSCSEDSVASERTNTTIGAAMWLLPRLGVGAALGLEMWRRRRLEASGRPGRERETPPHRS